MAASAGLPPLLLQALQQLQTSDSQLQQIRSTFTTANPSLTAGALGATLTDPAFTALVQQNSQSLMATVLLSGNLSPASDSGVSNDDGITDSAALTFVGTAPAGTTVTLFAQSAADSTPLMIGQGVSDGTGHWQITANRPADGDYAISVRYSGGASGFGQVTPLTTIVVDTVAPRITAATYNRKSGQVTVTFEDPLGLDQASLAPSNFVARMKGAALTVSGFQRVGTQEVMFTVSRRRSHPTSISLQVISSGVRDVAGNGLDGAFNGTFPTGSGHGSGSFSAQLPIVHRKVPKPRKGGHKSKR
jgi:hypothetical protein